MEISITNASPKSVTYADLKPGDLFFWRGNIFMRIGTVGSYSTISVSMLSGTTIELIPETQVQPVDGKLNATILR